MCGSTSPPPGPATRTSPGSRIGVHSLAPCGSASSAFSYVLLTKQQPSSPLTRCLQVRCIFRTIELSEGYQGHLTTTESYFYLFDVIPILNALIQFIPFWPGRFIPKDPTEHHRYLPTSVTSSSAEQVTLNDMERARSKPAGKPYY